MSTRADLIVVGGGIVGLATAWRHAERYPDDAVVVLEKEDGVARHQSGRNSGVLHSGVYYKPGSDKARLCREGLALMEAFCGEHGVPWRRTGKVIVAADAQEAARLDDLLVRGRANGVTCERIGPTGLSEREPWVRGFDALYVADSGVADYPKVCLTLVRLLHRAGHAVRTGAEVTAIRREGRDVVVETTVGAFRSSRLVTCGGLHSDRLARMSGADTGVRIVPFRGEYFGLAPEAAARVNALVYPVPDPRFPFLGVHLTRHVDGTVSCGPNAVPALAREGYTWRDVNLRDLWDTVRTRGFRRLARRHAAMGLGEIARSLSRRAFVDRARRLMPSLEPDDLRPAPAGVRAQAIGPDGALLDDFAFAEQPGVVHVLNAPSPAATASLAIAERIVRTVRYNR